MVQFLYSGEISYSDEKTGAQNAENLTEYFGFPPMSFVMNPKNNLSKYQNYGLKQDYKEEDIKIEMSNFVVFFGYMNFKCTDIYLLGNNSTR